MGLIGERAAEERELDWISAFAGAEEGELRKPAIQEIEAASSRWADLVPASASIRAAVARVLAERYTLDRDRLSGTRDALGLDEAEVAAEFERQTGNPIDSIWERSSLGERLRWIGTAPGRWLESTTPFRASAALTFLLSMGQSVVIVPIAVRRSVLGRSRSIAITGILALTTTAAMAEASARSGRSACAAASSVGS